MFSNKQKEKKKSKEDSNEKKRVPLDYIWEIIDGYDLGACFP